MQRRLILASASPRRRELLALLGIPFQVIASEVDEDVHDLPPHLLADRLARCKASHIWHHHARIPYQIVLGADTIVVTDRPGAPTVLNKPADANDARRMLSLLSGTTHTVLTGIALMWTHHVDGRAESISEVVDTQVTFRELTPGMVDAYLATGEPFDKAGAYGIQGYAAAFVEAVFGDYFNVVGLPVQTVGRMLERAGVEWWRGPVALETGL